MGYWRVTPTFNVKVSGEALIAALGVNLFLLLTGSLIHCRTTIGCMLPSMKCHNILRFRENYASQSANQ